MSTCIEEDELIHVDMKMNISDDIPLILKEDYKDSLLANLYSTVEFLKSEISEKNDVIKSLLSQLDKCISCNAHENKNENTHNDDKDNDDEDNYDSGDDTNSTPLVNGNEDFIIKSSWENTTVSSGENYSVPTSKFNTVILLI